MMRKFFMIGLVAAVFANPAAAQKKEPTIALDVLMAYWDFVGLKGEKEIEKDIEKVGIKLKVFMLEDPEKGLRDLEYLRKNGSDADFNKLYEEAWAFVSRIREDPVEAYRLSKEYAGRGSRRYRPLWIELRRIASKADIPEIHFDTAMRWFQKPEDQSIGLSKMHRLAIRKYPPAYRELIRRYLEGDGARKAPWLAYYWLRRGERDGLDVGGLYPGGSAALFKTLDERGKEWLRFHDKRGEVPPLLFKPSP